MFFKPIAAACIVAAAIPVPALARQTETQIVTDVRVDFADLNLATDQDAHELVRRLDRAANEACGGDPRIKFGGAHLVAALLPRYHACWSGALERAVVQVDHPGVTIAFRSMFPRAAGSAANGIAAR